MFLKGYIRFVPGMCGFARAVVCGTLGPSCNIAYQNSMRMSSPGLSQPAASHLLGKSFRQQLDGFKSTSRLPYVADKH